MARKKRRTEPEIITDPAAVAKAAKLRYVNDNEPGITRKKRGKHFQYIAPDGTPVTDPDERQRIEAIVIPPAWTEVWICADPNGHIQATGRDARGRKQYRYHERWRETRDSTKFDRMILFGETLPTIRERVEQDMKRPDLAREKVLAAVVALLGSTFIRVGNREYARDNDSYGLTTMQDDHVEINGSKIRFEFRGKSGKAHTVDLKDKRLAKIIKRSQDVPGQHLFQYHDEQGNNHPVTSSDVNAYLREISGQDFTAKDFRTWGGTILALKALADIEPYENETEAKKQLSQMFKTVAGQLGNTVAVCRKYYVHPAVIEAYRSGTLRDVIQQAMAQDAQNGASKLEPHERAVMALLRAGLLQPA